MVTKDSFDAFISLVQDKINGISEKSNQNNLKVIQNELKDKFDNLLKSQGYVSQEEYDALCDIALRLEERVSRLEEKIEKSRTK